MVSILTYQSSEIDWCEANFQHSVHVAEFYNTISNVTFFIVAPLMMYLMHPYARERTWAVHIFWPMLMVVGIFSAYYHMTLSYLGQLLDEISILWILAVGYSIWFPHPHFPSFIKDRRQFASAVSITACVSTLMSFAKPTVNAYVLNCVTFHIIYVLVLEMRKCSLPRIHRLAAMSVCWWLVAITCWLSDRLLCGFWRQINFCYLHSFWSKQRLETATGTPLFLRKEIPPTATWEPVGRRLRILETSPPYLDGNTQDQGSPRQPRKRPPINTREGYYFRLKTRRGLYS